MVGVDIDRGAQTGVPGKIQYKDRLIEAGTFIVGIDPQKFNDALAKPEVQRRTKQLEERYRGVQVIIGVDRLDYIKGLTQKLKGYDRFLEQHPEFINKVVLIQVAVPSREDVKEYQDLETEICTIAGKINGKHGNVYLLFRLHCSHHTYTNNQKQSPKEPPFYTCTAPSPSTNSQPYTPSQTHVCSPPRETA